MPLDRAELVEFRARQRTFNNAYLRTSLSSLTSSVVIFKLFDHRFYKSESRYFPFLIRAPTGSSELTSDGFVVGCLYITLAVTLAVISYARGFYSNEDFADHAVPPSARESTYGTFDLDQGREQSAASATTSSSRRIFGRPFVTAGWIVVMVTIVVLSIEFSILYLILHM